ncbi:hypothetical protein IC232_29905 [Microvirga sp. BT688]|uniref:hypothetical protein n=1 Tax=Microvirga sp. TaxID=1873136 RepID=UPI001684751F|nr:hypothetical protein [Microvirga sp.]MBD2750858.1 hypothetical protein [Microvirga sp.]
MLRLTVAVLASLEMLVVLVLGIGGLVIESDPAGEGMAMGAAALAIIVGLLAVLPALLAVYHNRRLWMGLVLTLLPLLPFLVMSGF